MKIDWPEQSTFTTCGRVSVSNDSLLFEPVSFPSTLRLLFLVFPSHSDLKRRVSILIDGSLIIAQVKPEDAGRYTCSPSNSLGQAPTASAHMTVQCK